MQELLNFSGRPQSAAAKTWRIQKPPFIDGKLSSVYVATPNKEIFDHVREFGDVVMTSNKALNGTERVYEAYKKLNRDYDFIINIQGDEPFINKNSLELLINIFKEDINNEINYGSLMKEIQNISEINNPNNVKVTVDNSSYATNFSRKPITNVKNLNKEVFYKHIGVYGYRKNHLILFSKLSPTKLELKEKIEALRIIESGHKIKMALVNSESVGIDTREDLSKAIQMWKRNK